MTIFLADNALDTLITHLLRRDLDPLDDRNAIRLALAGAGIFAESDREQIEGDENVAKIERLKALVDVEEVADRVADRCSASVQKAMEASAKARRAFDEHVKTEINRPGPSGTFNLDPYLEADKPAA